jgi:hypothetical protein
VRFAGASFAPFLGCIPWLRTLWTSSVVPNREGQVPAAGFRIHFQFPTGSYPTRNLLQFCFPKLHISRSDSLQPARLNRSGAQKPETAITSVQLGSHLIAILFFPSASPLDSPNPNICNLHAALLISPLRFRGTKTQA